jgi:fructose-bisphosphate aldolase class II
MSLVTLDNALSKIGKESYGIGAFNVANMEMVMGAIKAAEELKTPIILQVAEGRLRYSPLHLIGPVMIAAAKAATVPVVVHLDHGSSMEVIAQALKLGFSSVMFDGSAHPLEKNIDMTNKVKKMAKEYGASVEGEIGKVGGSEGDYKSVEVLITSVADAKTFYDNTQVDALAVAIGTAHGHYTEQPKLQFERLEEIAKAIDCPLVLHGGSGLTPDDFKNCIQHKIKKVNIATASFENIAQKVNRLSKESTKITFFQYLDTVLDATYENVKNHILIFGSQNKV